MRFWSAAAFGRLMPVSRFAGPLAVGAFAVLFRLLALRDLSNDHYMQLAWAQQLLFGRLPGRDFVDPGQTLATAIAAAGQWLYPGPFTEAVICAFMLGIAAGCIYSVTHHMTASPLAALLASLGSVALAPRLYNYPKLLVPAVALWLLHRYVASRRRRDLAWCGVWLVAGTLLRHDLGVYAALGTASGLVVAEWPRAASVLRALATTAAAAIAAALPYLAYVAWSEGLAEHLRIGVEFARGEAHQLRYPWPTFPAIAAAAPLSWDRADATALLYYAAVLLPLLGAVLVAWRHRLLAQPPIAAAAFVLLASCVPVLLRDPLDQRLPDLATPLLVSASAVIVIALRDRRWLRIGGVALAALMAVSVWQLGRFSEELRQSQLLGGPSRIVGKLAGNVRDGTVWPWTSFWPNSGGLPAAVLYLEHCTLQGDSILLTWSSPEYYFFTRRPFAGGHVLFSSTAAFADARDERLLLERLADDRPAIVLINEAERAGFRRTFAEADAYLTREYAPIGTFRHYDGAEITVAARRDLQPRGAYGEQGWPCYRVAS